MRPQVLFYLWYCGFPLSWLWDIKDSCDACCQEKRQTKRHTHTGNFLTARTEAHLDNEHASLSLCYSVIDACYYYREKSSCVGSSRALFGPFPVTRESVLYMWGWSFSKSSASCVIWYRTMEMRPRSYCVAIPVNRLSQSQFNVVFHYNGVPSST